MCNRPHLINRHSSGPTLKAKIEALQTELAREAAARIEGELMVLRGAAMPSGQIVRFLNGTAQP
jgi:hypothetical protein